MPRLDVDADAQQGEFEKPWFYHDLEGPTYEVRRADI